MTAIEVEFPGYFPLPARSGPTVRLLARDLSGEASSASGGYAAWDGSQQVVMPECWCVCGGRLVAETRADPDVLAAVQIHNATPKHAKWREAMGL